MRKGVQETTNLFLCVRFFLTFSFSALKTKMARSLLRTFQSASAGEADLFPSSLPPSSFPISRPDWHGQHPRPEEDCSQPEPASPPPPPPTSSNERLLRQTASGNVRARLSATCADNDVGEN